MTTFNGESITSFFASLKPSVITNASLDLEGNIIGNPNNIDLFEIQSGKGNGKKFLGGPICKVNGYVVSCLCYWSKKGSIMAKICVGILQTLDHLNVFSIFDGMKSLIIMDGHGSSLEVPFLYCIYNPRNEWVVGEYCPSFPII